MIQSTFQYTSQYTSQSTLRPTTVKRHMIFQKRCSCCRESGHNITNCDDPRVESLETNHCTMPNYMSEISYYRYIDYNETIVIKALCLRLKLVRNMRDLVSRQFAMQILLTDFINKRIIAEQQYVNAEIEQYTLLDTAPIIKSKVEFIIDKTKFVQDELCPICDDSGTHIVKYNCSHDICISCLSNTVKYINKPLCCALCRANITIVYIQNKKSAQNLHDIFATCN
jgi:hypothetical protein